MSTMPLSWFRYCSMIIPRQSKKWDNERMKKLAVRELEILHNLWLKEPKFRQEVEGLRKAYEIPTEGFSSGILAFQWLSADFQRYIGVADKVLGIIKDYKLPKGIEILLTEYVITNAEIKLTGSKHLNTPAYIVSEKENLYRYTSEEKRLMDSNIPYVKMLIYPHATKEALIDFIDKQFVRQVEPRIQTKGGLRKRIRTTTYKKRDRDIIRAWETDSGNEKRGMKRTKEVRVAAKVKTTPETVRKTLQKTRKAPTIK